MGTIQIPENYTPLSFGHHPISTPFAFFICKKTPKSSHLIPKAVLHILPRRISHHLPPLNYDLWLKASCIVLFFIYVFLTQRQSLKYLCLCCITRKLEEDKTWNKYGKFRASTKLLIIPFLLMISCISYLSCITTIG